MWPRKISISPITPQGCIFTLRYVGWFGISVEKYVGSYPQTTKIMIFNFSLGVWFSTGGWPQNTKIGILIFSLACVDGWYPSTVLAKRERSVSFELRAGRVSPRQWRVHLVLAARALTHFQAPRRNSRRASHVKEKGTVTSNVGRAGSSGPAIQRNAARVSIARAIEKHVCAAKPMDIRSRFPFSLRDDPFKLNGTNHNLKHKIVNLC